VVLDEHTHLVINSKIAILQKSHAMWRYWWYSDPKGACPWRAWYDAQNTAVRGKHDDVFRFLDTRPDWREPYAKKLDDGLVEVRIKTDVQHRLVGFCWPGSSFEFVFVIACIHKGVVYKPKNALATAKTRMDELINGSTWIKSCVRPK
jgi:hypothetical protein